MRPGALVSLVGVTILWCAPGRAEPPKETAPAPSADVRPAPPAPQATRRLVTSEIARAAISAAFRAAGLPRTFERLSGMAARTRSSALLPELILRAARSTDQSLRLTPAVDDPSHYSEGGAAGLWLEARLIWHLDRLAFDRDEISVERLRNEREGAAAKISERVMDLLFAWERASLRANDENASPDDRAEASLEKAESEVLLDVITAGWFARRRAAIRANSGGGAEGRGGAP